MSANDPQPIVRPSTEQQNPLPPSAKGMAEAVRAAVNMLTVARGTSAVGWQPRQLPELEPRRAHFLIYGPDGSEYAVRVERVE